MSWSEALAVAPNAAPSRRQALATGGALLMAGLGGCGFQLQQTPALRFRSIALLGFAAESPMRAALVRRLSALVVVQDMPAQADVVLQALEDARERSVVAITAAAQVRELQLRVRLNFRVSTPGGRELIPRAELLLSRDMSYSESTALAKEFEEAELFRDMQTDVVNQVLRRLAALEV